MAYISIWHLYFSPLSFETHHTDTERRTRYKLITAKGMREESPVSISVHKLSAQQNTGEQTWRLREKDGETTTKDSNKVDCNQQENRFALEESETTDMTKNIFKE